MIRFKQILYLSFFLFLGLTTDAQELRRPIGITELLDRVTSFSPALLADSASIIVKRVMLNETSANALPNLRMNYQADLGSNNNVSGPYMAFGIVPSNSRGVRTSSNTKAALTNLGILSLDWEIYNFGLYKAQNTVAMAELNTEKSRYFQSRYQTRAITIDHYLSLLKLQDMLHIQQLNISRNEQINRSIISLARSGIRAGVDTSIAGAELSKSRLNYIEMNNTYKQVQLDLAAISGIPQENIVADSTILDRLKSLEVNLSVKITDSSSHPLLDYFRERYLTSLEKEELVKKSYNPKVSLQAAAWSRGSSIDANDTFNNLSQGLEWQRQNYLVGIGISYNIFDIRRRQLKLRTQKASSNMYLSQLRSERMLLSNAALQADLEVSTAHKRLDEIPNQLKAARDGYLQKLSLYKNGLTDIIELNTALNILYRAESDFVNAKYLYIRSLFQKAIAINQVDSLLTSLK